MRKSPFLSVLALFVATPAAFAHDGERDGEPWYIQFGLGLVNSVPVDAPDVTNSSTVEVDFDSGLSTSLLLGLDLGGSERFGWSAEVEGLYASFSLSERDLAFFPGVNDGDVSATAWMGNIMLDFHFTPATAVYVGGGVGFAASIEYETFNTGSITQLDNDGVAGQFKAGLKFNLGDQYDVMLGYRYFKADDIDVFDQSGGDTHAIGFETHTIELNMRWGI